MTVTVISKTRMQAATKMIMRSTGAAASSSIGRVGGRLYHQRVGTAEEGDAEDAGRLVQRLLRRFGAQAAAHFCAAGQWTRRR